jgi:thioredoxin 1
MALESNQNRVCNGLLKKKLIINILNLKLMSKIEFKKDDNIDELLSSKKVTLLQFSAEWCGPCRMLGPIIDELSVDNTDNDVTVAKINVDQNQELAVKYGVRGIPTVIIFKDGEEQTRKVGVTPKSEFQTIIDGLL